jgi:ketosteroid isomerase-like protein
MTDTANLELVRSIFAAWEREDMEAVFALYDPAIEWDNSTLPAPNAGVYHGREGVRLFLREWLEAFETQQIHAEDFIDAGDAVVVRTRVTGRGKASGAEVEMPRWNVYRIRDGLVIRIEIFETKAEALEAAGFSADARSSSEATA